MWKCTQNEQNSLFFGSECPDPVNERLPLEQLPTLFSPEIVYKSNHVS